MSSSGDLCNARLKNSLLQPIPTRCYEIHCICEEFNGKDLYNAFPILVADIFGTENQDGWGLRKTFRDYNHQDFYNIVEFLRPQGVFFKMCYKLVSNNYFRYDFPLTHLPVKVRAMIEDGIVPAFYMDKLKVDHQTRIPTALSLNSFEYYMFHFAYHLVNPWIQFDEGTRDIWDTVYLQLAEEYILNFLPCSDSPVQPIMGYLMNNSFSAIPLQTSNRPVKLPTLGLFRQSVLLSQTLASSSYNSSPTSSQQNTRVEIWRSELVSQVFIDFWLSCESITYENPQQMSREQFYSPSPSAFGTPGQSSTLTNMQGVYARKPLPMYQYPKLPSMEHMRVVRNLLKHIHYFANSSTGSGTAMDELKRIILPSSRGKIYSFLRRMIDLWPLDTSFRLVLETWLSYIQPWRYTGIWTSGYTREQDSHIYAVDRKWLDFIAENLLAYTAIFRQVVQRFSRIDLVTPKNAVMLFRTTKVFSQPGLSVLIAESESCLNDSVSSMTMSHKMCAIVRQQALELEGPSYQYKLLFGPHTKVEMVQFCNFINQAYRTAHALQKTEELEKLRHPKSFLTAIAEFFHSSPVQSDNCSLEERTKVTTYLESSIVHMCSIFTIENFPIYLPENVGSSQPPPPAGSPDTCPERSNSHLEESAMQMHTPNQISPEAARKRLRHIHYEGDPDLEPIKSTENAFLVRFLFQISSKLNEMYSDEMALTYYRDDFYGRVARQVLCPPTLTRNYDKRFSGRHSPRVEIYLPPRLSLRTLASHWILLYFVLAALVAHFRGFGPISFIVFVFVLWAMYVVVRAFVSPWISKLQPGTRNRQPSHLQDSMLDVSFTTS